jgi:hypothetical protein
MAEDTLFFRHLHSLQASMAALAQPSYHWRPPWWALDTQLIPLVPHTSTYWVVSATFQPSTLETANLQKQVPLFSRPPLLCEWITGRTPSHGWAETFLVLVVRDIIKENKNFNSSPYFIYFHIGSSIFLCPLQYFFIMHLSGRTSQGLPHPSLTLSLDLVSMKRNSKHTIYW